MKTRRLVPFLLLPFLCKTGFATDIVTLSGRKYFDVHDVQARGNLLTFTTDTEIVKVPFSDLPPALRERYEPKQAPAPKAPDPEEMIRPKIDPNESPALPVKPAIPTSAHDLVVSTGNKYLAQMAADLSAAKTSLPVTYSASDAFSVDQVDAARKDALANGRPIGFFVVDDSLFSVPCKASEVSAKGALAHFVQTFANSVTPVFIFPQRDLAKLPAVLTSALAKPVPVSAPRVIFTNSEASEVLADLSLSSDKMTYEQRNEAIYPAVGMIKRWYVRVANSVP